MASGVAVPNELIETVKDMKLKKLDKQYTWMTIVFKPSCDSPERLEVGDKGTDDYESFKNNLAKIKDGCFAVVDVPLIGGSTKLVLISWAPDTLPAKPKMLVASTCGALKTKLEGVDQYQASDVSDLELKTVQGKVDRKHC